jgi:type IV pilus assembly protein PilC
MPTFAYEAIDKSGKPQKGTIEASSNEEAIQRIRLQNLYPKSVREQKVKKSAATGAISDEDVATARKKTGGLNLPFGKVKTKHLTTFTRQLSTLQDAGLPLLRSLQILESQQKPGKLKNVLLGVVDEVEGGSSLSEAMARYPRAFNTLYTKMVAAGEVGGVLDVILQRLSEFMEKAERLKRKVLSAMMYPVFVILAAMGIVTAIMVFIIPEFTKVFADFGVELPAITKGLIATSGWVAGTNAGHSGPPGFMYIILGVPGVYVFYKLVRMTKPGRAITDFLTLYVPVLGKLVRKTTIARFTRTLGTLIAAGVPILEAITITKETSGNWVFERALGKVHDSIREGESFAEPLRQSKTCDAIVVNMIEVGEETGDMDTMLLKIADNYDDEVDTAVAGLVALIEPLLVLVLGVIIGTIVVAMFMPMIAMLDALQSS